MLIARVVGEVVATQKHSSHEGCKLLMVQPLNLDGSDRGDAVVAVDAVDAGPGDRVLLVTEGFSAMTSVGRPQSPIESNLRPMQRLSLPENQAARNQKTQRQLS